MAEITFPPLDINKTATEVSNALKDGAYVAIGLGVLGFQRVQVQRVELIKQLEGWLGQLSELPTTWNSQVEDYAETARARAETSRTELAGQLTELSHRVEEMLAPARARLAKAVPGELPNFPDLGRQLVDSNQAMEAQLETLRTQLTQLVKALDERVQPVRQQLDEQFDRIEQYLPSNARNLVHTVRAAASDPEQRLRNAVGLD